MKKNYLTAFLCFTVLLLISQRHGNEWIEPGRTYVKFPMVKEGIYRIDSATLSQHFNLATVNPKNFRLFLKGEEVPLYVEGEADNQMNSGDYLEFYAKPLAGTVDSLIYTGISYQPNPYISLFNDTVYAFLTLSGSAGQRLILETDTNTAQYPKAGYFYTNKIFYNNNGALIYNPDDLFQDYISDPNYTQAESYGMRVLKGQSISTGYNLLSYTNAALPFHVTLNYSGRSRQDDAVPDHQVSFLYSDPSGNAVLLHDSLFFGYVPVRKTFSLNSQDISTAGNFTFSSIANPAFSSFQNNTLLLYIQIFYPHLLDLEGQTSYNIHCDNTGPPGKTAFHFGNIPAGASSEAVFIDHSNNRKIRTQINGNSVSVVVPNGVQRARCFLSLDQAITSIAILQKVNGNGSFTSFNYASNKKPFVIIYHPSLKTAASAYADYRKSPAGGGNDVIEADVQHLYEQFSYGVNKHPLAIRNFLRFLTDTLANPPGYVLLLGKGMKHEDLIPPYQSQNLVPTIGNPISSDHLLTAALTETNTHAPEIPIGRISALTNSDVTDYLEKVKQHEATVDAPWKKRVLHFVGGNDENLSKTLSQYMENYARIIKDTLFGGEVLTFKKNTSAPIQLQVSDSIRASINYGATLLNFFGHGSEQGFDQAIDDPQMFDNAGRYPFVIANSCYSGNTHIFNTRSVSERFAQAKQKGSIGFLATTSYGFDDALDYFTTNFYKALSITRYNQGVGDVIKEAAIQTSYAGGLTQMVSLDMTLEGDPSVLLSNGSLPDYEVSNSSVFFDLKSRTDSIGVIVVANNSGKAINDSIGLWLQRFLPNGDSVTLQKNIHAPYLRDTIKIRIPIDFERGIGLNRFMVEIDNFHRIAEKNENNNRTAGTVDLFVPGGDIYPVYPYKYAIVPRKNTFVLKASTSDPFAPQTAYRFQLDTNSSFQSPISSTLISSKGGVIEWTVSLTVPDSVVYFWRVSRDSLSANKGFVWRESSFQMIENKRGWGQSHFNQFSSDGYRFVNYKKEKRQFEFENTRYGLMARTGVRPTIHPSYINSYFNNQILGGWPAQMNGWCFALFDSVSGLPIKAVATGTNWFGQFNNCVRYGKTEVFSFGPFADCGNVPTWKTDMENFLNWIPNGMYVLGYNVPYQKPWADQGTYSNSLYTAFESLGLNKIRITPDSVGYAFFGKKGWLPGQANEKTGKDDKEIVYLQDTITTAWNSGYIASEILGPSLAWRSLHWRHAALEDLPGDSIVLKVIGITASGQQDTLISLKQDSLNVQELDEYIPAVKYPYLKLVALMKDDAFRTAPQLKRWQVIYDPAPECAINPLKGFVSLNDKLQEGDFVQFNLPVENISETAFKDSLVITCWLEDAMRNKVLLPDRMKKAGFSPGELLTDTIRINSYQLRGNNIFWVYVNPIQHSRYQHEQLQFNNIATHSFAVSSDATNPLLDVTFDGVRILNGDIVSAKPEIFISLKDENKFLALNDTSAFNILLSQPGQAPQRLFFAKDLQFTPAQLPKNSAEVRFRPNFVNDGRYALQVQARDRSKNASGVNDYRVEFEVDNRPAVTQVLNYPNPFSTSTHFVFTLTGSEIPEVFTIQIMTITGKLVREITRSELGYLHIGRNITTYAWDGRDQFGDRLANGVYLYRVVTRLNGQKIELRASQADQFFTKEFGKMVLMR